MVTPTICCRMGNFGHNNHLLSDGQLWSQQPFVVGWATLVTETICCRIGNFGHNNHLLSDGQLWSQQPFVVGWATLVTTTICCRMGNFGHTNHLFNVYSSPPHWLPLTNSSGVLKGLNDLLGTWKPATWRLRPTLLPRVTRVFSQDFHF